MLPFCCFLFFVVFWDKNARGLSTSGQQIFPVICVVFLLLLFAVVVCCFLDENARGLSMSGQHSFVVFVVMVSICLFLVDCIRCTC